MFLYLSALYLLQTCPTKNPGNTPTLPEIAEIELSDWDVSAHGIIEIPLTHLV